MYWFNWIQTKRAGKKANQMISSQGHTDRRRQ